MMVEFQLRYLLLSLPAGFFWLWYVYHRCRFHPPPIGLVGLAFVFGMASPAIVLGLDGVLESRWPWLGEMAMQGRLLGRVFYFIVMVGLLEELSKFLSVRLTVYYARSFDDVVHGVVFSSAAALGFATVENARYVEWHGPEVLLGRVVMSTFGHVLMSMIWGVAMGAQKRGISGWGGVVISLALAAVIHGVYDLLLLYDQMWMALVLLFVLWRTFVGQIEVSSRESPHRPRVSRRVRECPECNALVRGEGTYCGACGRRLPASETTFCAACLKVVEGSHTACASCGAVLI